MAYITLDKLSVFAAALANKISEKFLRTDSVDSALSASSTNPIQNKAVNTALGTKVPTSRKINGKGLAADISLSASDIGAIAATQKGVAGGVAELDTTGKVPSAQLPSFVDDVLEGYLYNGTFYKESAHSTQITPESGKIYVDIPSNKTYRWSGTAYVTISDTIALGETSSSAYRGDRGKAAYVHSQSAHAPADADPNVQADWNVTDAESDAFIKHKPTSMPANGGNASTVNGHSVNADVPAGAKFTDTTYAVATASKNGLMSAADKKKLDEMTEATNTDIDNIIAGLFS